MTLKALVAGALLSLLLGGAATAQTCSGYTYSFSNGSTADASQVNANFSSILNCANTLLAPLANPHFTGNVGVGTIAPWTNLTVQGASGGYAGTNNDGVLQVTNSSGNDRLEQGLVQGSYAWLQAVSPGTALRNLVLSPGGGNVGIGTTAPGHTLSVNGAFEMSNGIAYIGPFASGYTQGIFRNINGSTSYNFQDNGFNNQFTIDSVNHGITVGTGYAASYLAPVNGAIIQGNLGIGTTSPGIKVTINDPTAINSRLLFQANGSNGLLLGQDTAVDTSVWNNGNGYLRFATNSTERMRIDGGGLLYYETTGQLSSSYTAALNLFVGSNNGITMAAGVTSWSPMVFLNTSGAVVGTIGNNNASTAYNTTSDYRLKTNVEPISDGLKRLMVLEPKRFNWKSAPAGEKVDGFLAHEVQIVAPGVVTGKKDAVNRDGSIDPQMIDYSKLVPLLVAAIKDEQAEIENLKTQVAALKSGR